MSPEENETHWVYVLECENGSYYTGYALNLVRRYWQHLQGLSRSRYTRSFRPRRIAGCWQVPGVKGCALRVESYIKSRERAFKEEIIADPGVLEDLMRREYDLELSAFETSLVEEMARSYTTMDYKRGSDPLKLRH